MQMIEADSPEAGMGQSLCDLESGWRSLSRRIVVASIVLRGKLQPRNGR